MNDESLSRGGAVMSREDILKAELDELRRRHRVLDEELLAVTEAASVTDALALRRLKKQKLLLKDQIAKIEDQLTPDIIA